MRKQSDEELAFQDHTSLRLGRCISNADDEKVYRLRGYPNRVVKIIRRQYEDTIRTRLKVIKEIKEANNPAVVKIYQVDSFDWQKLHGKTIAHMHSYYYIMEKLILPRLNKTTASNAEEVWWALNKWELPNNRKLSRQVKTFIKRILQLPYKYNDVHQWNILQSKRGALKFIDLEGFSTTKRKPQWAI